MPFVKYIETGRSFASKASVSKTGLISFNDGARRRFLMDEFDFCVLYYDKETRKIGIELTKDENAEGARKLRKRTTGADVAAKSFIDFFQIPLQGTTMCDAEADEDSNLIVLDLKKGTLRKRSEKT
ncbi:MAG: hypothetical protein KY468_05490 [Armatimonadetes bacterium]|nr:hypothetical protein [Armatimonadota bacterium]